MKIAEAAGRLRRSGLRTLTGVVCDSGGVLRAKSVPAEGIERFAQSGMGASLTWPVFCVDNWVALTESLGVVGDLRLTADLDTAVVLDSGFGWACADVRDQEGERSALCWRDVTRRAEQRLKQLGIEARIGNELEFTLVDADGASVGDALGWPCYGLGNYSRFSEFAAEVCEGLETVGVPVQQIHAEYGVGQMELTLPPRPPVRAADNVLLARTVLGRVARRHGLGVSFSPVPFAGGSGNGAHLHLSFTRAGEPLLAAGSGQDGLTREGESALAGIVAGLPGTIAVLAGTVVSAERMQPGHWSGAFSCWGVENREAAVRLIKANAGNPLGANVEVKCVDGGANSYLAAGLILGLAADGIEQQTPLPPPIQVDPASLNPAQQSQHSLARLPVEPLERIRLFSDSAPVEKILGVDLRDAIVAVRKHEATLFAGTDTDVHAATRFAWSA